MSTIGGTTGPGGAYGLDPTAAGTSGGHAAIALAAPALAGDSTLLAVLRGEQTLANGSRGDGVKKLQAALASLGAAITPDGSFGAKTGAALSDFQGRAGLPKNGRLDGATVAALDRHLMGLGGSGDAPAAPAGGPPVDLMTAMRNAVGATGTSAAPSAPAPPPAPDYTNWFTDADKLPVPSDIRRYLDQALTSGRHEDVRALRNIDYNLASTDEKARLFERLLDGHTDDDDERWMLEKLTARGAPADGILDALARRGKLGTLFADFQGAEFEQLLRVAPSVVKDCKTAASVVGAILKDDTRRNRLAAHHVFDAARAGKYLDATLAELKRTHGASPVVNDLIAQAKPTIRPTVTAHRGGLATEHAENTMPALKAAVAAGIEGIEVDLTVTKDGKIVLWHDYDQSGIVPAMREAGMEPGGAYKPHLPPPDHAARRPIHELNLSSFQANYGYAARDGNIFTNEKSAVAIPTFDEVAAYLKQHPEVKQIALDVKLPPDRPDVQDRFAAALKPILERYGLQNRVYLMHNDAGTVRNLKSELGSQYPITHDVEIVSLAPSASDYSAVESAKRLGNSVASVGRPRIGIGGYETYLDVLKKDRAQMKADAAAGRPGPKSLVAWTINDELEMREIMAIGVNGIITDDPKLLARLNRTYFGR